MDVIDEAATKEKDPHLPPMGKLGGVKCPRAPRTIAEAQLDDGVLVDLAAKFASTINRFAPDWLAERLHVSLTLANDLIAQMTSEGLIEETMITSGGRTHRITERGRRFAERAMEVCGYLGPAPVSLDAYSAMLRWEFARAPEVKSAHVTAALSNLVLPTRAVQLAGLAVSSGRSLFVYGPSGNGKSSVGRQIHAALRGEFWIPHCIAVRSSIIRLFDEQVHHRVELEGETGAAAIDRRWIRIRRPMVVVGGELTLEYLDLVYSPTLRYYEAPPHLKANGGVFLVDDFGRERVSPHQLLNRFITPMEHHFDYFTLSTGQKIQVPLRQVLIIATNLSLETVTDPAFLRRMGYRLCLEAPTPEAYAQIFKAYAERHGATVAPEVIEALLERYRAQNRELRACEPRDLIERARDICRFNGRQLELSMKVLDLAWTGYFGTAAPAMPAYGGGMGSGSPARGPAGIPL